jgi:hypothetical protein
MVKPIVMKPTPIFARTLAWVSSCRSTDWTPGPHVASRSKSRRRSQTAARGAAISMVPLKSMRRV